MSPMHRCSIVLACLMLCACGDKGGSDTDSSTVADDESAGTTLADLASLQTEFPGDEERREPISSQLKDAWDNWGTLLLALALLSAEWIMRKRYELI